MINIKKERSNLNLIIEVIILSNKNYNRQDRMNNYDENGRYIGPLYDQNGKEIRNHVYEDEHRDDQYRNYNQYERDEKLKREWELEKENEKHRSEERRVGKEWRSRWEP